MLRDCYFGGRDYSLPQAGFAHRIAAQLLQAHLNQCFNGMQGGTSGEDGPFLN